MTIVACATAWGRSAVALLRLSGADALTVGQRLCPAGPRWRPRRAALRRAVDPTGALIDEVLVTWMPGPRSYTGEDVVELSCHGNPVIIEQLLDRLVVCGARPARPGEFTRRAVEQGRIDLLRAESVAALIAARAPAGVAVARAGLDGALETVIGELRERLLDAIAELEARLDHGDDELTLASDAALGETLARLAREARTTADTWRAGRARVAGARVALVGPVNAGKSSLFNQLVGRTRALVGPQPGITRDVVEESVLLDGLEVTFLDTAGRRSGGDAVERAGMALGETLTADVDLKLVVMALHMPLAAARIDALAAGCPALVVGTHIDCSRSDLEGIDHAVSNLDGTGIDGLHAAIRQRVGGDLPAGARAVLVSQRQHELFVSIAGACDAAREALLGWLGPAVAAVELTGALSRIAELRGDDVREDVLDRLFSRFCIGK